MEVPRTVPEGLLTGLALVLAVAYAPRRAPLPRPSPQNHPGGGENRPGIVFRAWLRAALGGLCGGHALFLLTHGGGSAADWLFFWSGGQSVFGVLAGGTLAGGAYLWMRGESLLDHADLAAPAVALGYAVARVGCFFDGDDFGAASALPWAVRYGPGTDAWAAHAARGWIASNATASLAVHPVQLYLALAGFSIFLYLHRRSLPRGAAVGTAALAYGAARLLLEPLRDDFAAVAGPFSLPQLFALALLASGIALLATASRRPAAKTQLVASGDAIEGVREGGLRAVVAAVSTAPAMPSPRSPARPAS
jgi:phosphatidylglycerol:prolipoprotein diacylglycerol transferase